ncbi:MAG: DUF3089 domain-containing protein [Candidatus Obscuribacterales bacterium]|nr:DUF3089 domain-containing protein [Steroidobacteraceae bacterium]
MRFTDLAAITLFGSLVNLSLAQDVAPNYSKLDAWVCHPENKKDACDRDLDITVIAPDGKFSKQPWKETKNQPIDCFYVYPTTSLDPGMVSDLTPGKDEELITAYVQAARFRSQCRVYAPLYRQNTVTSLRAAAAGKPMSGDRSVIYADVLNSWNHYLQHDNKGRGVVLIGHSQGAGLLTRLIAGEIDRKPIQKQLVSAFLIGSAVAVPKDKAVGGSFKNIPLCTAEHQIGCVVTFASYRATMPPVASSNFGRLRGAPEGNVTACTNPAALTGGKAKLDAAMSTVGEISLAHKEYLPWTNSPKKVPTPFVSLPGLLQGECVQRGEFSYLEITINADPNDARTDDVIGDVLTADGGVNTAWGLHLIDMSMTMGNLLDIVGKQTKMYLGK